MEDTLHDYPIVSVDVEFPGCFRPTPRHAAEEVQFADMKHNVDITYLIQLGVNSFKRKRHRRRNLAVQPGVRPGPRLARLRIHPVLESPRHRFREAGDQRDRADPGRGRVR
ncbi:unnamed protein product [Linum tenue]|uniref:Uncharacterized protein n=1 Tax=Linum tenue TaxID=586396 RepID=A0AAV0LFL4_9ROSI|nr:unnamed protein product [Linum tenue]